MVPLSSRNALVILSSFSLPFPFHTLQSEKGVTWLAWIPFILPKWHIGPYYLSSTYVFHDRHVVDNSHGTLWSSMVSCFHLPSWLWMVIRNIRTLGPRGAWTVHAQNSSYLLIDQAESVSSWWRLFTKMFDLYSIFSGRGRNSSFGDDHQLYFDLNPVCVWVCDIYIW
jgi:hypothetical protein